MLSTPPGSSLSGVKPPSLRTADGESKPSVRRADPASRRWLEELRAPGAVREAAIERLHALLLRAARFEVARRRRLLPHLRGGDLEDVAHQAADDALVAVLARLDDFRGESRFTTWAYKFALLEAAVKLRKRAWQGVEVPLEPETWELFSNNERGPAAEAERGELLEVLHGAIADVLVPTVTKIVKVARGAGHDRFAPAVIRPAWPVHNL